MILVDIGGKKLWLHGSRNGHVYGIDRDATVAGKAGKEHKCVWVTALQRVNWTKPHHSDQQLQADLQLAREGRGLRQGHHRHRPLAGRR